jgi:hypothetical protein
MHAANENANFMNSAVQLQELRQATNLSRLATPLLPLLREPATLDIVVNRDESVWVNRLGTGFERAGNFSVRESTVLLQGIATIRRIAFNHDQPILETIFPLTGDRIEGLISLMTAAQTKVKLHDRVLQGLARMITGDARHFPYRRGHELTKFFKRCGLPFVHDGTTRATWAYERLAELNLGPAQNVDLPSDDICRVISELFDPNDFDDHNDDAADEKG